MRTVFAPFVLPADRVGPTRENGGIMKRIRLQPAGQRFRERVEEWMQSLTDRELDVLAARRDQLVGQLEALYRSVRIEMGVQT
jgi:hypothetical protein